MTRAEGNVSGPATDLSFAITDGESEITVHSNVAPLGADGIFKATQVIVKHDENYVAPEPGEQPSDRYFEPGDE